MYVVLFYDDYSKYSCFNGKDGHDSNRLDQLTRNLVKEADWKSICFDRFREMKVRPKVFIRMFGELRH